MPASHRVLPEPIDHATTAEHAPQWLQWAQVVLGAWLILLVLLCVLFTRHWPLVNDGALQHYISFLEDTGKAPYRDLLDMNLPGSLLIDWTVVHTLGAGAEAWRTFDACLMLAASWAMLAIAGQRDRFAGLFAAALFWLLHARDGMGQTGQRDMMESALLLAALAFLCVSLRQRRPWLALGFGVGAGIALTIKPDTLVFTILVLLLAERELQRQRQPAAVYRWFALAGVFLPLAVSLTFLARQHAILAFVESLTEVTPYYATLGRLPFSQLVRSCFSAPMRILGGTALLLLLGSHLRATPGTIGNRSETRTWERSTLLLGLIWGVASFFVQGKGYLYHRYPALGFLLLWSALVFAEAIRIPGVLRVVGAVAMLYGALVIAPASYRRALHSAWDQSLVTSLQADLIALGGVKLSNQVQCIDSISGCNTALLRLQLPEETGMLSDFLLFGPETRPAVRRTRNVFWREINAHPPRVFIVTSWLHPLGLDNYAKLAMWPAFQHFLEQRYRLVKQCNFRAGMNGPLSYRVYTLR